MYLGWTKGIFKCCVIPISDASLSLFLVSLRFSIVYSEHFIMYFIYNIKL